MRMILVLPILFVFVAPEAVAADDHKPTNAEGYRDCSLKNLPACQNSNQLVSRLTRKSFEKKETTNAIRDFLKKAPETFSGHQPFNAAEFAVESFWGPGAEPFRFSTGEWFFDGFTPHDATDTGAVIFNAHGKVLVVATSNLNADSKDATAVTRMLRIYMHHRDVRPEFIRYLQKWARDAVEKRNKDYPNLPDQENSQIPTELLIASDDMTRWETQFLP